jgi:hypothetical protein
LSESKFLHSIGTSAAERQKILVNSVVDKAKRQQETIIKDIGIGTSLTEDDMKEYVTEVEVSEAEDKEKK